MNYQPFSHDHSVFEEYAGILKVLPDIVYKIDADGRFVYLNDAISILGFKPNELIGKHFSTILHPDDVQRVSRDSQIPKWKGKKTGDHSSPKLFDERRTGKRGTRNLMVRLIPKNYFDSKKMNNNHFLPAEIVATAHYKTTEEFENKVSSISNGKAFDPPLAEKTKTPSAFIGKVSNFGNYSRDIGKPEKKFYGTIGVIRDVTERAEMEEQKRTLEQQLQHAKKIEALGDLAGGITHDFNNLLSIIEGHLDVIALRHANKTPGLKKYIDIIKIATNDAADLNSKLLAFARKGKYENKPIEIRTLISDVLGLLKHTFPKDISISTDIDMEPCWTEGDTGQLKNALLNIAINAKDAMPYGGELNISCRNKFTGKANPPETESQSNSIHIAISDTGIGMQKKIKDKVFVPFFTTKAKGKGTGMGMASVYGTIESHHGTIRIDSEEKKGTTVHLVLPGIKPPDQTVSSLQTPRNSNPEEGENAYLHFPSRHVLVVDDEEWVLSANVEVLKFYGFTTAAFDNARAAIEHYRTHHSKIDLALLDVIMPDINGIECFHSLKKVNPAIKAILATGYTMESETQEILLDRNIKLLQKPYNHLELMKTIKEMMGTQNPVK